MRIQISDLLRTTEARLPSGDELVTADGGRRVACDRVAVGGDGHGVTSRSAFGWPASEVEGARVLAAGAAAHGVELVDVDLSGCVAVAEEAADAAGFGLAGVHGEGVVGTSTGM